MNRPGRTAVSTTDLAPPALSAAGLGVLLTGQFMANVDTAVVNIAAPSIRADLGSTDQAVGLVVSIYVIAFATLLVVGARLGAAHGYRTAFLGGLVGFTAASLACGLAPSMSFLILARLGQGCAAALMVSQVLAGIHAGIGADARARAMGGYAVALSGGAVTGQVAGGLLVSADIFDLGWRVIFLINVPVGMAALVAGRSMLPRTDPADGSTRIDLAGAVTLGSAVLLMVLPLAGGPDTGWPAWRWLSIAASAPMLVVFALVERRCVRRGGRPLISPAVVGSAVVRRGLLAHGLTTSTYLALLFVMALYLQHGLGLGPASAGLAMVTWVAAFGVAGLVIRRLPRAIHDRLPMIGCAVLTLSYAALSIAVIVDHVGVGAGFLALLGCGGFGLGLSASSLITAMTRGVDSGHAADLSGAINTNAQLWGAIGVAVFGAVYAGLLARPGLDHRTTYATVLIMFAAMTAVATAAAARLTARMPDAPFDRQDR